MTTNGPEGEVTTTLLGGFIWTSKKTQNFIKIKCLNVSFVSQKGYMGSGSKEVTTVKGHVKSCDSLVVTMFHRLLLEITLEG